MTQTQYQLLPPLSQDDYEALKSDIAARGVMVPVEVDEQGNILDGHHRVRAWKELRADGAQVADYPRIVRFGLSEDAKTEHALALNLERRHMTATQRTDLETKLQALQWSNRRIAEQLHVDEKTVRNDLAGAEKSAPETVVGRDGKKQRVKKKPKSKAQTGQSAIFANSAQQQERAQEAASKISEAPNRVMDIKAAERKAREQDAAARREEIDEDTGEILTDGEVTLYLGDFRQELESLENDSVDLIMTDPPYPKEYLPLWADLAAFAARVLRPGGYLVSYSGQSYLPQVYAALSSQLEYVWTMAQIGAGPKTLIHHVRFYSKWKPILVFAKPPRLEIHWVDDTLGGGGPEKAQHEWQQAESEARYCIEHFSSPGALVVDPFVGGGTSAIAARNLGRKFVGCDIDAASISQTMERLSEQS